MSNFRVRYRSGEFEVEIESSDRGFVDSTLAELLSRTGRGVRSDSPAAPQRAERAEDAPEPGELPESDLVNGTVAAVQNDPRWTHIWKTVLKGRSQLDRVLLVYYFAEKTDRDAGMSALEVHKVTKELHSEIAAPNVAKVIRESGRGFLIRASSADDHVARYRINREGRGHVERLLSGAESTGRD